MILRIPFLTFKNANIQFIKKKLFKDFILLPKPYQLLSK